MADLIELLLEAQISNANPADPKTWLHRWQWLLDEAFKDKDAEIEHARSITQHYQKEIEQLRSEEPGTPCGRLKAIADYAKGLGLCSGTEAKPPELYLIEYVDTLRKQCDDLARVALNNGHDLLLRESEIRELQAQRDDLLNEIVDLKTTLAPLARGRIRPEDD